MTEITNMKIKTIIAISDELNVGFLHLQKSLIKHNYDYTVLINPSINWNWAGLEDIYKWGKTEEAKEYTHFIYTDGFDTVALQPLSNVLIKYKQTDKMLFSTEKQCFPRVDWIERHPKVDSEWQYLNHGQFIAPIETFLRLYEGVFDLPITCQEYAMDLFLNGSNDIILDTNCEVFQTVAFCKPTEEFEIIDGSIVNIATGSLPSFAHGNGKTNIQWVYDLI